MEPASVCRQWLAAKPLLFSLLLLNSLTASGSAVSREHLLPPLLFPVPPAPASPLALEASATSHDMWDF